MALLGSLTSGVSALKTFAKGLEVIGNNVANVNTTGFKAGRVEYADSFSNLLQQSAPAPASGVGSNTIAKQIGTGVQLSSVTSDFGQGILNPTGSVTDLGIAGDGYFRVRDAANAREFVTRSGDFRLDDQGYLVTNAGLRVQGLSDGSATYDATSPTGTSLVFTKTATAPSTLGDIRIDFDISIGAGLTNSTGGAFTDAEVEASKPAMESFTIDQYGNVLVALSNGDTVTRGKVLLQNFRDPNALMREGSNLFTGIEAAGPIGGNVLTEAANTAGTNGLGKLQVGALELSNVDLTGEFADLITTQRSFQAGSRIITVSDQMLDEIVNLKR